MRPVFLVFLIFPVSVYSQKFTVDELLILNNLDWNAFDSVVTSRGYSLENKNTTAVTRGRMTIHANSNRRIDTAKSYRCIQKSSNNEYSISKTNYYYGDVTEVKIILRTNNIRDYNGVIKALKKGKFKYINSESHVERNSVEKWRYFRRGGYTISLVKGQSTANNTVVKQERYYEIIVANR